MNAESARKIRSWMVLHGLNQRSVARELGVSDQLISAWFRGKTDSRPVAEYFKRKGCPKSYFRNTKYEETRAA